MHLDEPEKREPSAGVNTSVRTIAKASMFAAFVAGLTSVIYLVARDQPGKFPVFMPAESQPVPPEEPVKKAPQPK